MKERQVIVTLYNRNNDKCSKPKRLPIVDDDLNNRKHVHMADIIVPGYPFAVSVTVELYHPDEEVKDEGNNLQPDA